ncbi:MAG: Asparagine synthetase [Parcubacteria group bacterium GW2011_GWA1_47_8]|nr:MAG: Asparagine synthetase [Parcubacteria group bacterium GW2011_GWA1_47_8]
MCGIIGITGNNVQNIDASNIPLMLASLSKRGPDDHGTLAFPSCLLGQTRLSIVDLSGGHQPMKDAKRDMAITFNGEIYNYRELKKDLEAKGYVFSTHSDTEVILKMYQEHGEGCLHYLDGMFAFAIWDNEKKLLFMARDRFGKKPFYYAFDQDNNLIFASEIKAIFASGKIQGIIDPQAIDNYLALMYIPPHKTVYKNIFTLAPAECATYHNGTLTKKKYWELSYAPINISYDDAKEKVRQLLTASVKKRMVADVEIGSFLSGGVDSTLVTLLAQSFSKTPIKTFSVGYQNYINELPFALEASKRIGTDHYPLQAKNDMTENLRVVMACFDEPHADSSDFPQYLVSKLAASKVKVALSGDGADELFMGYGWYTRHRHLSYRAHFFEKLLLDPFQGYVRNISIWSARERKRLWGKNSKYVNEFLSPEIAGSKLPPIAKINLFDLTTYLPGQLLTKADRMGMMNSLEVRSPFLDHHLTEFAFNLPQEDWKTGKKILKDLLQEIMPLEFVNRKKQGFGAPVKMWLKEPAFKDLVHKTLLAPEAEVFQYLDKKEIGKIIEKFYGEKKDSYYYKIWVLLCLELWLDSHKQYHTN